MTPDIAAVGVVLLFLGTVTASNNANRRFLPLASLSLGRDELPVRAVAASPTPAPPLPASFDARQRWPGWGQRWPQGFRLKWLIKGAVGACGRWFSGCVFWPWHRPFRSLWGPFAHRSGGAGCTIL